MLHSFKQPKTSPADSLDSVQKVGENAVAAATSQSSEDGGKGIVVCDFEVDDACGNKLSRKGQGRRG